MCVAHVFGARDVTHLCIVHQYKRLNIINRDWYSVIIRVFDASYCVLSWSPWVISGARFYYFGQFGENCPRCTVYTKYTRWRDCSELSRNSLTLAVCSIVWPFSAYVRDVHLDESCVRRKHFVYCAVIVWRFSPQFFDVLTFSSKSSTRWSFIFPFWLFLKIHFDFWFL